jgi:hypothetical protein
MHENSGADDHPNNMVDGADAHQKRAAETKSALSFADGRCAGLYGSILMNVSHWNGATGDWRRAADWSNGVADASTQADFTQSGSIW